MSIFKRTLGEFLFRRFMLKYYSSNLLLDMNIEAKKETIEYIKIKMGDTPYFEKHRQMLNYVLEQTNGSGFFLEFGVGRGKSMRWISSKIKDDVHGFDSFDGIQEHWNGNPIGAFAQKQIPKFKSNVKLHVGYFNDTLKEFLETSLGPIAFLHIDCDLYSSTVTIFDLLGNRLRPGSVILFDEYYNYYRWKYHEYKAFQEFVKQYDLTYEYIAYSVTGQQVAIRILTNPSYKDEEN
ncbi:MAG: methyltransferase [Woeseia sp.]|nr:methyltransferase [Woeseia sp.]